MLNARIRNRGLSAWEILFKRDQFTNCSLDISDNILSDRQHDFREKSHLPSAKSKSCGGLHASCCDVSPGSLVYVKGEGDKYKPRERYLVTDVEGDNCVLQKLSNSLRNVKYSLKKTDIFPVSSTILVDDKWLRDIDSR